MVGCECYFAPPPEQRRAADPSPRGRVTVDANGFIMEFEPPKAKPRPGQRLVRESDKKRLERRLARKIELAGLPTPTLEYYWAKPEGRMFHSEFAWPEQRVLAEVQGGIWAADPGRHNRGSGYEADCARDNLAQLVGWRVLRFTERMIGSEHQLESDAIKTLRRALRPAEVA